MACSGVNCGCTDSNASASSRYAACNARFQVLSSIWSIWPCVYPARSNTASPDTTFCCIAFIATFWSYLLLVVPKSLPANISQFNWAICFICVPDKSLVLNPLSCNICLIISRFPLRIAFLVNALLSGAVCAFARPIEMRPCAARSWIYLERSSRNKSI